MVNNISAFERFLLDGGVCSPDLYCARESEDFSPEGAVNVKFINSFAKSRDYVFEYDMIA